MIVPGSSKATPKYKPARRTKGVWSSWLLGRSPIFSTGQVFYHEGGSRSTALGRAYPAVERQNSLVQIGI